MIETMFHTYTVVQWICFFFIYSFIGWVYESIYVSLKQKHWVNRGFMLGPFLPLYGSGAIMMLFVSIPFRQSLVLTFLSGCVGATLLEYVTGVVMESLFKVRYWDYSTRPFNFQGHICLAATLAWGAFTILLTRLIHKPVETMVLGMPYLLTRILTVLIGMYVVADFSISFKTALDIRDVLVKMDRIKEELLKLQKRLDVMIAFTSGGKVREEGVIVKSEQTDTIIASLEDKFNKLKEMMPKLELSNEKKEELTEMLVKFGIHKERRFQLSHMKDFYRKEMLKGNPSMVSVKFKEALEELKKAATESRTKK